MEGMMDFEANDDNEEEVAYGGGRVIPSQAGGASTTEDGDGGGEPQLNDILNALNRSGRGDLVPIAHQALDEVYRDWIQGREGRPGEVLQPALTNLGFVDAGTGRLALTHHTVDQAREIQVNLKRRQLDIMFLMQKAGEKRSSHVDDDDDMGEEADRTLEKEAILQLMSLSNRLVRILDHACILYQSTTLLLEQTSSKWHTIDDWGDAKYYRQVLEVHPITHEDVCKDQRAKMVLFLLRAFQTQGFRKKADGDFLYERVFCQDPDTDRPVFTYAYGPVTSRLEDLVYEIVRKELRAHLWPLLLHSGTVRDVVTYFRKSRDIELPEIKECPTLWSFQDGVYCAERDLFAYYSDVPNVFPKLASGEYSTYKYMGGHVMAPHYFRRPFRIETPGHGIRTPHHMASVGGRLSGRSVAFEDSPVVSPPGGYPGPSPYVEPDEDEDDDMDDMDDMTHGHTHEERVKSRLEEIEIPTIRKIFRDQDWSDETIYLALATIGRTFFPVGYLDSCQYWPCYLGVGGSGKSTILDIVKEFFHFPDIGVISSDTEDTFSRNKLPDKRIVLAPEVRGDNFGCSLPFFLAIVGGDAVSIPVKYGDPRVVETFPVQGIMASNELPKSYLKDPKGSLARRLLVFPWPKSVTPRDPTLKKKIRQHELPAFLRACAVAYQSLPKDVDIMSNYELADEMKKARLDLHRASNSLIDFLLTEEWVVMGAGRSVPLVEMEKSYKDFARDVHSEKNIVWGTDTYDNIFRMFRLRVEEGDEGMVVQGCALRRGRDN